MNDGLTTHVVKAHRSVWFDAWIDADSVSFCQERNTLQLDIQRLDVPVNGRLWLDVPITVDLVRINGVTCIHVPNESGTLWVSEVSVGNEGRQVVFICSQGDIVVDISLSSECDVETRVSDSTVRILRFGGLEFYCGSGRSSGATREV